MKKRGIIAVCGLVALLAAGCAPAAGDHSKEREDTIQVLATTYPTYLAAQAVTEGVEGVSVSRLNTGEVSCLHDYTLTVGDMKQIESADLLVMNGAGLEDFMHDALESTQAQVVDCSQGVDLLESRGHVHTEGDEEHDQGHWDPHYWMDPENMEQMVVNVQNGLLELDPAHGEQYRENTMSAGNLLALWDSSARDQLNSLSSPVPQLITFHDGFQYFARAYDLPLLASIEEEEGSEASAKEIHEISQLVQQNHIPMIFTEVNGSDATAQAITRETGCQVDQLTMMMSGLEQGGLSNYQAGLDHNITTIVNGFAGREGIITE